MNSDFTELKGTFGSTAIAGEIVHLNVTTSTMDVAWKLVRDGAADGTVVIADHQSEGRGRHDRSWVSKQGKDILCSVILRPRVALAGELLMLAALSVSEVADSYGMDTGIKWPNDVQVKGLKIAGVIAESITGPASADVDDIGVESPSEAHASQDRIVVVIGIGFNVNFDPESAAKFVPDSTSLSVQTGKQINRLEVFRRLLLRLDHHYSLIAAGGSVVMAWRNKLTTLGREVTVVGGNSGDTTNLHGLAHDVDSIGRLIVRDENGKDWPVSAGEVTVRDIR
jgi:BirA family biotin operon repressor/biotin-[acetyl-CoA-carboxylase] ligase